MNIIKVANYEEMSKKAAQYIIDKVRKQPNLVLGLATGSTPKGVYKELIHDYQNNDTSYKHVKTVNLDEYIGIPKDSTQSYHYFMKENLFNYIDIPIDQTYIPSGISEDMLMECAKYEYVIQELGGIDLQLLGIGQNGHIGFNEPGTSFKSRTHIVTLEESTRKANSRFFSTIVEVPTKAVTVGIATILDSREILLLASGSSKAKALQQLVHGDIDEFFPASALKTHHNVTIIADEEALIMV